MKNQLREPSATTGPLQRLAGLGAAWLLLYCASPGIVVPEGLAILAPAGIALWAFFASRPGRGAFWIETLAGCIGWCGICSWAAMVHWTSLLFIGPGLGLYYAGGGLLLRRLARHWPLAIAAPAAWMGTECIRSILEPPFGLNWMRLGIHAHDIHWLAGSARVWGVFGLSYVLAALGGGAADQLLAFRFDPAAARIRRRWALIAGGGPLALAVLLAFATSSPETETGPRVLLVQPGIAQERKMKLKGSNELFIEGAALTAQGLEAARVAGERPVDFVAWGESMLPMYVIDPALREAVKQGALPAPWVDAIFDESLLNDWERREDEWVRGVLLKGGSARAGILPSGTVFVSGVEVLLARGKLSGRQNAIALWSADGTRSPTVGKRHLVPAAETMLGLERYAFIRDTMTALAGYIPDLLEHTGSRRLEFQDRAGRKIQFGASVCFDNAYDGVFVEPLLEGPVDFHLVASNEAWFKGDQEPDQMMAFSHLAAIATGRSVVRATNSGISAVIDPAGREVARLVVEGRDREVSGTLRADIPIPTAAGRELLTPYTRSWRLWPSLALLWPLILLIAARRFGRGGYQGAARG